MDAGPLPRSAAARSASVGRLIMAKFSVEKELGRSAGRRKRVTISSARARMEPLVLAYIEANPTVKRSAVAMMFGTNPKMIHRILTDNKRPTFHRRRAKQLELFPKEKKRAKA